MGYSATSEAAREAKLSKSSMHVIETGRLILRRVSVGDAPLILAILTDPVFLRLVGDRGVRTLDQAREYIVTGAIASYERYGFGPYLTSLKASGVAIGICSLLQRETLDHPDLGVALLPEFRGQGYGPEAAAAVVAHARDDLGLERVLAITSPENRVSIQALEKLGFGFERRAKLFDGDRESMVLVLDT